MTPKMRNAPRQPNSAVNAAANGANIACPMGFPLSARPSIRPRACGNQGAKVAVIENDAMAVCPMPAKIP